MSSGSREHLQVSILVVLILVLPFSWSSLLEKNNMSIPDNLFTLPLASEDTHKQALHEQRELLKSKTLLEPIIIHHKNKGVSKGGRTCQGACIPPRSCDYHGGLPRGHCLTGSICCQFERSCGGVSREKISFFRSPDYPVFLNESVDCNYQIHPSEDTCALRIEFLEFQLARSTHYSKVDKCMSDAMYILNTIDGANEPVCDMENHTAIVYVTPGSSKPITLLIVAQSNNFKWNLKITQVNCKKLQPWKNEPNCGRQLMYEPATDLEDDIPPEELELKSLIVNGKDAETREFPWQISLQTRSRSSHRCGGSIINDQYILTAAHCVMRTAYEDKGALKVVVGDYILNMTEDGSHEELDIESIFVHYHYKPQLSHMNDIAIIKVVQPIKFSPSIQPICLAPEKFITAGLNGWVSGWGRLNGSDAKAKATTLQKLKVNILSDEKCQTLVKAELEEILHRNISANEVVNMARLGGSRSQMCAQAKLSSAVCFGDSGGPLVIQKDEDGSFVQVGVVSYGLGHKCITERNPPAAYTRISEFLNFIAIATASQS